MNKLNLFMKASRFRVIPVMIIPVILGAMGAYAWEGIFHPFLFVITLVGAGAAHLFSNMINDLWDFRNGVDVAAKETASTISTNSGYLANGIVTERIFAALTWMLLGIALICGIILSFYTGWGVLIFGGIGALIAYFYVAPPLKFGYRGKGYSEVAILVSFGILPVMGTYFVQTLQFDYRALMLSLPIGLLTTLILFNHHFLHWQSDKESGKLTLVVVWGERRALQISKFLLILAYLSLLVCVIIGVMPIYVLLALVTFLPVYKVYKQLQDKNPSQAYLPLLGASLKAAIRCGLLMSISLLIQGIFQ
ncbi:prenyltransferase [Paenibacillus eucommiae]|uniref:1,4-dihydroxy-2-naphthoate octaprenyltransferase n=1 Tax=Paenibacillus eucommiae TaxID=1355755 RepID=A0ABS4IPN4_9BACL|nr:prenyltransferase [Paenibacillus eucommiae]MBP1989125.1 1,4-dihydroxy-2-naphthoate octaprenyltransferase [Paenibacillus eucommiae]